MKAICSGRLGLLASGSAAAILLATPAMAEGVAPGDEDASVAALAEVCRREFGVPG